MAGLIDGRGVGSRLGRHRRRLLCLHPLGGSRWAELCCGGPLGPAKWTTWTPSDGRRVVGSIPDLDDALGAADRQAIRRSLWCGAGHLRATPRRATDELAGLSISVTWCGCRTPGRRQPGSDGGGHRGAGVTVSIPSGHRGGGTRMPADMALGSALLVVLLASTAGWAITPVPGLPNLQ